MHENSTRKPLKLHFTQYLTVLYANEVHDDFNSGLQIMSEKSIQNNESAVLYFSQCNSDRKRSLELAFEDAIRSC